LSSALSRIWRLVSLPMCPVRVALGVGEDQRRSPGAAA